MNYRQLQSILKQVKAIKADKVECKLNSPWAVLVHEWNRLLNLGYWAVECEETREVRVSYNAFYNFNPEFLEAYYAKHCTPKVKTPINWFVSLSSFVNSNREIILAYVELIRMELVKTFESGNEFRDYASLVKLQVECDLKYLYGAQIRHGKCQGGFFLMWGHTKGWEIEIEEIAKHF